MGASEHRGTIDAEQFGALCNLFCLTHCTEHDPTAQEAGDVLYFGANMVVCDHSRMVARAVLAYLGISFGEPVADEILAEVKTAMLNGRGSLPDAEDAEL